VRYMSSFADAVASAVAVAKPGDMILTLGAGNVSQLGPAILEKLGARKPKSRSRTVLEAIGGLLVFSGKHAVLNTHRANGASARRS